MGKDRSGKLDVLLGINDSELKTPKHDKLCIWVDKNIKEILIPIIENFDWNRSPQYPFDRDNNKYLNRIDLKWEEPIKGHNGFVIGIPDFKYSFIHVEKRTAINKNNEEFEEKFSWKVCGFIEVKPTIKSVGEVMRQIKLYKSQFINSNKSYENLYHNATECFAYSSTETPKILFIIVTQTPEFKDIFEKQNINYFVVTDEMLKNKGGNLCRD